MVPCHLGAWAFLALGPTGALAALARWLPSWTAQRGPSVRARSKYGRSPAPAAHAGHHRTQGHQPQQTACRVQAGWKDHRWGWSCGSVEFEGRPEAALCDN